MKKSLSTASPRLQRMLLQLQNYNLDVHYVRGTYIPVSDFLSRHSLTDTHPKLIEGLDLHVHAIKPGRVAQSVGHLTRKSGVLGSIPSLATYFRFSFRFFKKGSCQLLAKVCARSTG